MSRLLQYCLNDLYQQALTLTFYAEPIPQRTRSMCWEFAQIVNCIVGKCSRDQPQAKNNTVESCTLTKLADGGLLQL